MNRIDRELQRLEQSEQDARARFLRLQGVAHPDIVRAAQEIWHEAADALRTYERVEP